MQASIYLNCLFNPTALTNDITAAYDNNAGVGQVSPSSHHLLSPYNAVACGI